jgi:hypothetical protein
VEGVLANQFMVVLLTDTCQVSALAQWLLVILVILNLVVEIVFWIWKRRHP